MAPVWHQLSLAALQYCTVPQWTILSGPF